MGTPSKVWWATPPTFWKGFPGLRGQPDLKHSPKQVQTRTHDNDVRAHATV